MGSATCQSLYQPRPCLTGSTKRLLGVKALQRGGRASHLSWPRSISNFHTTSLDRNSNSFSTEETWEALERVGCSFETVGVEWVLGTGEDRAWTQSRGAFESGLCPGPSTSRSVRPRESPPNIPSLSLGCLAKYLAYSRCLIPDKYWGARGWWVATQVLGKSGRVDFVDRGAIFPKTRFLLHLEDTLSTQEGRIL